MINTKYPSFTSHSLSHGLIVIIISILTKIFLLNCVKWRSFHCLFEFEFEFLEAVDAPLRAAWVDDMIKKVVITFIYIFFQAVFNLLLRDQSIIAFNDCVGTIKSEQLFKTKLPSLGGVDEESTESLIILKEEVLGNLLASCKGVNFDKCVLRSLDKS